MNIWVASPNRTVQDLLPAQHLLPLCVSLLSVLLVRNMLFCCAKVRDSKLRDLEDANKVNSSQAERGLNCAICIRGKPHDEGEVEQTNCT